MENDKSPDTSSATSTFSRASNQSGRTTRSAASKALDFSLASGLPSRKRRPKTFRGLPTVLEMEISQSSAGAASRARATVDTMFADHIMKFGIDEQTGKELDPPAIPLCRLSKLEMVRTVHHHSEVVEDLVNEFRKQGYVRSLGVKFLVTAVNEKGEDFFLGEEERLGWDECWRSQDDAFVKECEANEKFEWMKDKKFSTLDGNHRLFSWMSVANQHPLEMMYHPRVECLLFKADKASMVKIEMAMIGRNK